jgi:predicted DCC family thiol-disulfide oxidoreductase YuxK
MQLQQPVILFDGICNLCESTVQFLLKKDKKKIFRFGSLQSPAGISFLQEFPQTANADSVVLIHNGHAYTKSGAAIRIAVMLGGFYVLLKPFLLLPGFLRDGLYNFIAKRRYKWFGKKKECWIPTPELKDRFID